MKDAFIGFAVGAFATFFGTILLTDKVASNGNERAIKTGIIELSGEYYTIEQIKPKE